MMCNWIQNIYEEICNYKYVSFDLFDTLIKRSVSSAERIFELVEIKVNEDYKLNIKNFKKSRILAERKARRNKTRGDITLNDIYDYLDYEKSICTILKQEEIDIEVTTCCENTPLVEIFHMCLQGGQNIIVTTDMYLDKHTIYRILNKIGVSEYQLFLSSEIGCTKQTGALFAYILSDLNIMPTELIHIGDNKKSDYDNALMKGIHAIWLNENKDYLKYWKKREDLNYDHLYCILKNKHICSENVEEKLGYKLVGPVLYNFCMWLNEENKKNNFKKIVFIAREGYLPWIVYKVLFPSEKDRILYLKINKNTLRLPVLFVNDSLKIFLRLIPDRDIYCISDIIDFLYIDQKAEWITDLITQYDYSMNSIVKRSEMTSDKKFIAFYKECVNEQKGEMEAQYRFLLKYFTDNNLEGKVALVNNSINGNTQFYLQLIKENSFLNLEFWGMYFISSKQGINKINNQCSIWFNKKCRQFEKRLFYRNCLIFEHLLFEPCGTALNYIIENDKVEVVCRDHGYELENDTITEKIKGGVLEFISDYVVKIPLCIRPSFNLNALCNLYLYPTMEDAKFICNMKDDDYEKSYLSNKWNQGKIILSNKTSFFYNLKLHLEMILRKMV